MMTTKTLFNFEKLQEDLLMIFEDESSVRINILLQELKNGGYPFKGYADLKRVLYPLGVSFKECYDPSINGLNTLCFI